MELKLKAKRERLEEIRIVQSMMALVASCDRQDGEFKRNDRYKKRKLKDYKWQGKEQNIMGDIYAPSYTLVLKLEKKIVSIFNVIPNNYSYFTLLSDCYNAFKIRSNFMDVISTCGINTKGDGNGNAMENVVGERKNNLYVDLIGDAMENFRGERHQSPPMDLVGDGMEIFGGDNACHASDSDSSGFVKVAAQERKERENKEKENQLWEKHSQFHSRMLLLKEAHRLKPLLMDPNTRKALP
ncbi:hypothetical protein GH714_029142 [Hevea brasiliensis]|uniref:Uncharacterized protein n=1 Tax=Hevea brasiliensis TaxID=3981 RepID=A0A6A6NDB6_HEVBR|nr:hypothetical protein GH714_029142 [Hevea brasiliensis]